MPAGVILSQVTEMESKSFFLFLAGVPSRPGSWHVEVVDNFEVKEMPLVQTAYTQRRISFCLIRLRSRNKVY